MNGIFSERNKCRQLTLDRGREGFAHNNNKTIATTVSINRILKNIRYFKMFQYFIIVFIYSIFRWCSQLKSSPVKTYRGMYRTDLTAQIGSRAETALSSRLWRISSESSRSVYWPACFHSARRRQDVTIIIKVSKHQGHC